MCSLFFFGGGGGVRVGFEVCKDAERLRLKLLVGFFCEDQLRVHGTSS